MVLASAREVLAQHHEDRIVEVTIFVPKGEELARRTFNPRLGIRGGISILGTTGIVKPYSHEAYKDTIRCSLDIARATGCKHVVLSTGSRSEQYAQRMFTDLPESAFIQIGDHVAYTLGDASARQLERVTTALFFGKLVKIAQGRMNTHVGEGLVQLNLLSQDAQRQAVPEKVLIEMKKAHTAREVLAILVRHRQHGFINHLCRTALRHSRAWTEKRLRLSLVLFSFTGDILWYDGESIKVA
jgi:cobalt-precorrin-5B (C1)-methyltransferase